MEKRGEIAFQVIIFAAIALIVLVIVVLIFRGQIGKGAKGFSDITDQTTVSISGDSCKTLLSSNRCLENPPEKGTWDDLGTDWIDCKKKSTPEKELSCYEKIS